MSDSLDSLIDTLLREVVGNRNARRAEHLAEREFVWRVSNLLLIDMRQADRMVDRAGRVEMEFEDDDEQDNIEAQRVLRLVQEG